jgi:SAM-dependent methyltransferase
MGHQSRMYFFPPVKCEGLRHRLRRETIEKYISETFKVEGLFLDIGCAEGYYVRYAAQRNHESIGLDIDKGSIKRAVKASELGRFQNVHYVVGDAGNLPFKSNVFKAVLCSQTLEHLLDHLRCMDEMRRVTLKNGWLIVSVPTETSSLLSFVWRISLRVGLIRPQEYGHLKSFHVNDFLILLGDKGFKVKDVKSIHVYYMSSLFNALARVSKLLCRFIDEVFYRINLTFNKVLSHSLFVKRGVVAIVLAKRL